MPVVIGQIQKSVLPDGAATQATLATLATEATLTSINTFASSIPSRASEATLLTRAAAAQLPAVLVAGRLDINAGAWLGSTAPTVGQKAMASSIPVALASDQSALPITAAALPLPTGAATEATLASRLADATFTSRINTQGQKPMAASTPVALASDQSTLPISAALLPLPTGAATEATLATRAASAQLPAALVGARLDVNAGAWLGSTAPTVGQKAMASSIPVVVSSDQSVILVTPKELATFWASALGIAPDTNKSMLSVLNAAASPVVVKVYEIWIRNVQLVNIAGVIDIFELHRITGHSAGTLLTPEAADTVDALSASVTARTASTIAGETAAIMDRWFWSSDEWGTGALDVESYDSGIQNVQPSYCAGNSPRMKPITLRAGEGITLKQTTATTVGTWDVVFKFTQE